MFLEVQGDNVQVQEDSLYSKHEYKYNKVTSMTPLTIEPQTKTYTFKTDLKTPKMGVLLVGLGGNNGSTVTGGILANKHNVTWMNKRGLQKPNYYGSITQSSTIKVGVFENKEVYEPMNKILPMVDPSNLVIGGWDISDKNLFESMKRAQVLDWDLIQKLEQYTKDITPLPAVYYEDFIACNQKSRADHILKGSSKRNHLEEIRKNIRDFKEKNELEKVIVLWTANTERFCVV